MYWIHKHTIQLRNGGPEEGGWWYMAGQPVREWVPVPFTDHEEAMAYCRKRNEAERERRKQEEDYDITSVLAYRSTHYDYSVEEKPEMVAYPETRPHYE